MVYNYIYGLTSFNLGKRTSLRKHSLEEEQGKLSFIEAVHQLLRKMPNTRRPLAHERKFILKYKQRIIHGSRLPEKSYFDNMVTQKSNTQCCTVQF